MANVLINEQYLTDIANAIREQSKSTDTYKPKEMAAAISELSSSGSETDTSANAIIARTLSGNVTVNCSKVGKYGLAHMTDLISLVCYATTLDEYALSDCRNMTSVSLPNATTIGKRAFYRCNNLTKLVLPQIKTLVGTTFVYCNSLTTVDFGSNIATLYGGIFDIGCDNLNAIIIRTSYIPKCEEGSDPFPTTFKNTYTQSDAGYIYVPRDMIRYYQNFECEYETIDGYDYWTNKKYRAIEDYPSICG